MVRKLFRSIRRRRSKAKKLWYPSMGVIVSPMVHSEFHCSCNISSSSSSDSDSSNCTMVSVANAEGTVSSGKCWFVVELRAVTNEVEDNKYFLLRLLLLCV
ncbi:hypothetical protein CEXT_645171 [Caerostris extrusa]|uniref:Uncharacterized protein n=1 Tax=Caerostris extrusa TaxID=172846 RepID=A0AAV4WNI4_CAEEX|nr:hypothetical protein CEXT_645171 [Caerostris extrusa]